LWLEYKWVLEEAMEDSRIRFIKDPSDLAAETQRLLILDRLTKITNSKSYLDETKKALMRHSGCRLLKPQRLINLTLAQEQARAHGTWRAWDKMLYQAAFADAAELSKSVAKPEDFIAARAQCVLGLHFFIQDP
jgi:hypothetical protein